VTKPIVTLTHASTQIANGKLDQQIDIGGNDEVGTLARSFCLMRDAISKQINELSDEVNERKRAEEELDILQNYLSDIIDSMPSILIGVDNKCIITRWNAQAHSAMNISADEAIGQKLEAVIPHLLTLTTQIENALATQEVYVSPRQNHMISGHTHYEDITVYPLVSAGGQGAVIRIDDVTVRVQLETAMVQSEKMNSVGGLAAGMAHEINNPLAVITQGIQNIQRRLDPSNEKNIEAGRQFGIDLDALHNFLVDRRIISFLDGGRTAVERAAIIVKNMLMFSRKSDSILELTSLPELIEHTISLGSTDYDLKKKYDFKFMDIIKEYDPAVPMVMCCATEIEQVLLNIFKNALQAMETIETEGYIPLFHIRLSKEVEFVRIEVEDNGPGIPPEIKKRIFEPFFTTKPVGSGTGLGLSVSYMIITQNHGGVFEVESEPGAVQDLNSSSNKDHSPQAGKTKFIIKLPV